VLWSYHLGSQMDGWGVIYAFFTTGDPPVTCHWTHWVQVCSKRGSLDPILKPRYLQPLCHPMCTFAWSIECMNSIRFMACRFPGPAFQCGGSHLFRSAREICFAGQEVLTLTSDFASDSWMSNNNCPSPLPIHFPRTPQLI